MVQLAHEIRAVPGIDFIPRSVEFHRTFAFSAGLASNAKESVPAKALLLLLFCDVFMVQRRMCSSCQGVVDVLVMKQPPG